VLSGWNQSFLGSGLNYTVSGSQGGAHITLPGLGSNHVTAGGWNNTITVGNGTNVVDAGAGNEIVVAGNGTNTLKADGWNNSFTTGSGHNTIVAGQGNETVSLGGGTDTVTLAGWNNLVSANGGLTLVAGGASNTYQVTGVGTGGGLQVADFGTSNNDVLDLSKLLGGVSQASLGGFLQVQGSGDSTIVSVDVAGGGHFSQVAMLGHAGAASLSDLLSHNAIKLG
jgi:Ca2+-binding RTX toxin-like protein